MSSFSSPTSRRGAIGAALPLAMFALLIVFRALAVDHLAGAYTGCAGCLWAGVMQRDLALFALDAALLAGAWYTRKALPRALLRIIAALVIAAWAADLAIFMALTQRLYLGDLVQFGGEGAALADFALALAHAPARAWWFGATFLVLATLVATLWPRPRAVHAAQGALVSALVALALFVLPLAPVRYVHPEVVANLIELNLGNKADLGYSARYRASLAADPPVLAQVCDAVPRSDRPDVVLVLVESLSAYHSALLGGAIDAVPTLDRLARDNHYFTNFLANGFTTNGGRIALYTGRAPLPPPGLGRSLPLAAYDFRDDTLLDYAHRAGYSAHYFTSGDLGFVDSARWLDGLGFDSVEGSESPFYAGMKRGQFDAPEDRALFDRFIAWLDARDDATPFLATLLTVTTHPPFVDPATGKPDELASFRYVDRELHRLHDALDARGFFRHGVLVITGDHRSMTPLHADEYARWGESAFARVPMVVIGNVSMPGRIDAAFAQTDFATSFAELAGLDACRDEGHGRFFRARPEPAGFLLHASGQERNRVDVYTDRGRARASYYLAGDAGFWRGEKPADWRRIQRHVDAQRLREAELAARR